MARLNMTQSEVVRATGLDERTIRSLLRGVTRPQARTLHKLAEGLGVDTDELFKDPYQSAKRKTVEWQSADRACFAESAFDRATNPIAAAVVDTHPELFENWAATDFSELFSRMAVGGELTEAGTLAAVHSINDRSKLMHQVAVILESSEAKLMHDFIKLLFERVTTIDETST